MPAGKVFQAGTLSGNPVATAAGIATLKKLKTENPYPRLETLCKRLETGLEQAIKETQTEAVIQRVGSMLTLFFNKHEVQNWSTAESCDTDHFARYFWSMMDQGIYLPCSQYEAMFVSATHDEAMIDTTIECAKSALQQ